jgi:hypothetical protein
MEVLWNYYGDSMDILWNFCGTPMEVSWMSCGYKSNYIIAIILTVL